MKEILESIVPKEFKYISLGFNFGAFLGLGTSYLLSFNMWRILTVLYGVLLLVQLYNMKDEIRELFN